MVHKLRLKDYNLKKRVKSKKTEMRNLKTII